MAGASHRWTAPPRHRRLSAHAAPLRLLVGRRAQPSDALRAARCALHRALCHSARRAPARRPPRRARAPHTAHRGRTHASPHTADPTASRMHSEQNLRHRHSACRHRPTLIETCDVDGAGHVQMHSSLSLHPPIGAPGALVVMILIAVANEYTTCLLVRAASRLCVTGYEEV